MILALDLIDRWGERDRVYVTDPTHPELTDEYGAPVLDLESNPFFPARQGISSNPVKTYLDSFMCRPSPGLPTFWVDQPHMAETHGKHFADAISVLTGKILVGLSTGTPAP